QVKAGNQVEKVAVDLELSPELVTWAISERIDLLYLHHPPIWVPFASFSHDDPYFVMLQNLYQNGVSVFAHHTNLDSAPGGLAEQWVKILFLEGDTKPLLPCSTQKFKLITFVPLTHLDEVSQAAFSAGAGVIGNYRGCSFATSGTGTFIPQEGAKPFLGTIGRPEQVSEMRLEVEVRADLLNATIEKIRSAHPYEEPVVDVYPLVGPPQNDAGLGRMVVLSRPLGKEELKQRIEQGFSESPILYTAGKNSPSAYQKVALCPGSGKSLVERVMKARAEVFVTGELSHHEIQRLLLAGIDYLPVSHGRGEKRAMQEIYRMCKEKAQEEGLRVEFLEGRS
ncbi:MAG: YqfO family protein, partial [Candidatus Caldatribacteriaceae bacterium]